MNLLQRLGRGLEAGMLAGGGVAVLFFATDVIGLVPLQTVTALAAPLLGDATVAAGTDANWVGLAQTAAGVTLYTLLHFATFVALGIVASWAIPAASFWGTLGRGAIFGALACSGAFFAGRALVGSPFLPETVGPVALMLTNVMAGLIMAAVFAVHVAGDEETSRA